MKPIAYVRVTGTRQGFVEFDFSLGDPTMYLSMILSSAAFDEFCAMNAAVFLSTEQAEFVDKDRSKWRFGVIDGDQADAES